MPVAVCWVFVNTTCRVARRPPQEDRPELEALRKGAREVADALLSSALELQVPGGGGAGKGAGTASR